MLSRFLSDEVYEMADELKEMVIVLNANHIDLYDDKNKIPFYKIEVFCNIFYLHNHLFLHLNRILSSELNLKNTQEIFHLVSLFYEAVDLY